MTVTRSFFLVAIASAGISLLAAGQTPQKKLSQVPAPTMSRAKRLEVASNLLRSNVNSTSVPAAVTPAKPILLGNPELGLVLQNVKFFNVYAHEAVGHGVQDAPSGNSPFKASIVVNNAVRNKPHLVSFRVYSLNSSGQLAGPGQYQLQGQGVDQIQNLPGSDGWVSCVVPASSIGANAYFNVAMTRLDKGQWRLTGVEVCALY